MDAAMIIPLLGYNFILVNAIDYLESNHIDYKILKNTKLNLNYIIVKDIISCSTSKNYAGQLLMPSSKKDMKNVIIFKDSYVYDHDKTTLINHIMGMTYIDDKMIEVDEAVPLAHLWSENFYHFTFECLPKLLAIEDLGYTGKYIVPNKKHILEYLNIFNISMDRILFSGKHYHVKNMIIPQNFNGYDLINKSDIINFLRDSLISKIGIDKINRRVYIKRIANRMIKNEDQVMKLLKTYDFFTLIPENFHVKDQFKLMTSADISLMPHGANCTLVLLQKKGSKYIECFDNNYVNYHTLGIIKALNLDYTPLVSYKDVYTIDDKESGNQQNKNIIVHIPLLRVILENYFKNK